MTKRVPVRALLIAALITALLAGTALAAKYVYSSLNARVPLPEASEALVDASMASFESALVRYQPIDALVDGDRLIMTIEVLPIDPVKHLLANGWSERDCVLTIDGMTWPEFAKTQGKTLVKAGVNMLINGEACNGEYGEVFEGDRMLITINNDIPFERSDPTEPLEIELTGYDQEVFGARQVEEDGYINTVEDAGEMHNTVSTLTILPKAIQSEKIRFEGPFEREYVTIEAVEFDRSALSLTMMIRYTLHDNLPEDIQDALPEVRFVRSDPTGQSDYRTFEYDALDYTFYAANAGKYGDFGSPELPPTNTYIVESVWPAVDSWPESLEVNILYKGTGEWDEPLVLMTAEAITAE